MRKLFISLAAFILLSACASHAREELLILFDASLSMGEKIDGVPKYRLAANEAANFVSSLPASQPAGLRIIGLIIDNNILHYIQQPEDLCKASRLAVPISEGSADSIKNHLKTIFPLGVTPLVYSIDTAVNNDFSAGAMKHIILVTDGADACGGDLCGYIKHLMSRRNDVKIDVIALGAEAEDIKELKCLAQASSGKILPVSSPQQLQNAYQSLFSFKRYEVNSGLEVKPKNTDIEYKNILMEFSR